MYLLYKGVTIASDSQNNDKIKIGNQDFTYSFVNEFFQPVKLSGQQFYFKPQNKPFFGNATFYNKTANDITIYLNGMSISIPVVISANSEKTVEDFFVVNIHIDTDVINSGDLFAVLNGFALEPIMPQPPN